VSLDGGPFALDVGNPAQLLISGFSSTTLGLSFAPVSTGHFTNAVELLTTGGNSTNLVTGFGAAPPLLTPQPLNGTSLTLSFPTLPGRTYVLEYEDSLAPPSWLILHTVFGDGTVQAFEVPVSDSTQRFFHLRVPTP
jgi:hypothetical protein